MKPHNDWTPPEILKRIDVEELSVQGDSGDRGDYELDRVFKNIYSQGSWKN